jgi:hypothetical protein
VSEWLKGMRLFENNFRLQAKIEGLVVEWKRAYPTIDIKNQLAWAHSWLVSNPKNVKKDIPRFLNNWMKGEERRNQERRGGIERRQVQTYKEDRPPEDEVMTAEDIQKMKETLKKK